MLQDLGSNRNGVLFAVNKGHDHEQLENLFTRSIFSFSIEVEIVTSRQ